MDPLTDFLPAMRVERAVYTCVEATAPWGLDLIAYHHTKFGIVVRGHCWINVEGDPTPVALGAGDCYLLPRGNAFTLRDSPASATQKFEDVLKNIEGRVLRHGGGGEATTILGGRFIFAGQRPPPVLDILPALVHFKVSPAEMEALQATLRLLAAETTGPSLGSPLIVDRLADIFFVQTLRAYIGSGTNRRTGWLGAVTDSQIGNALRALHEKTEHAWTLESLAAAVGMSRSAFALRFKTLVGEAPMEYLTRCRIHKASRLLRESDLSIGQVAQRSGYDSEASFNKAFKRQLGLPPGKFRNKQGPDVA